MTLRNYLEDLGVIKSFIPLGPTRSGKKIDLKYVTVHNTANAQPGADAAAHNKYIRGNEAVNVRGVSWHFTVDDDVIYHHMPVQEKAIHAQSGNNVSVGVEICMNKGINEAAAYKRAAGLIAYICFQFNIPVQSNVVQHAHWHTKDCPSVLRASPDRWPTFIKMIEQEASTISQLAKMGGGQFLRIESDDIHVPYKEWSADKEPDIDISVLQSIDNAFEEIGSE